MGWRDGTGTLRVVGDGEAGARAALPPDVPVEVPVDVRVEVPVEIAASYRTRARGLLGRDGIDGAMLLTPCGSVHTFRMRFAIDVAYLDRRLRVIAVVPGMRPGRLGLPRPRARHVLEAEAGALERWGVRPGVRLVVDAPVTE
ncbi:DUF192 domain-containing protein [Streptomyces sp. enrichment culture]|uniref:DUF192 domain-containing protein n=1 Tax=Streptomyces sp. enrichment culture TaxID=1795815 RepID=UPI003F566074